MALHAGLISYTEPDEKRRSGRRTLRLQLPAVAETGAGPALVYNLSERGLLLETAAAIQPGDLLIVELPGAGATPAEVIWAREGFAGCEFRKPLSSATVSAALLRADPKPRHEDIEFRTQGEEWSEPSAGIESPWLKVLAMSALAIALLVATLFIVALLRFPFSVD